jgi:hypothetical protein
VYDSGEFLSYPRKAHEVDVGAAELLDDELVLVEETDEDVLDLVELLVDDLVELLLVDLVELLLVDLVELLLVDLEELDDVDVLVEEEDEDVVDLVELEETELELDELVVVLDELVVVTVLDDAVEETEDDVVELATDDDDDDDDDAPGQAEPGVFGTPFGPARICSILDAATSKIAGARWTCLLSRS